MPGSVVIAGGKKLPEKEALELCYNAINDGAAGVDMGRNVFQSTSPVAMSRRFMRSCIKVSRLIRDMSCSVT